VFLGSFIRWCRLPALMRLPHHHPPIIKAPNYIINSNRSRAANGCRLLI